MSAATLVAELSVDDLQFMEEKRLEDTLTDMDFLETLAAHRCLLVPPWILRLQGDGTTRRVCRVCYDDDMNLNKPRILLNVLRANDA